jgi:filamentous hemagglutinin family protein
MAKTWKGRGWWLSLAAWLTMGESMTGFSNRTLAQMTPDTTLGAESSVVTPNVNMRGLPADRIDGGATRGTNLFHSFSDFNVGEGLRVYFSNPSGIENILTRVTGNNLSNILGTLGVDGGANLFLLNPNGIIFGQNAQLDIAGSFVASTANGITFDNGFVFSAKNPEAPPLLTINVPLGLQYGSNPSGATIANSGNLTVGQNLGLAADNLDLQGQLQAGGQLALFALNTLQVRDSTTKPFMAKAGGQMVVQGNQTVDIFALNHSESGFFSGDDMVLRSANTVLGDARYWSGGSFRIEGLDGTLKDLSSPNDPIIRSIGDVSFNNYIGTSLHILAGGRVRIPGIVAITAPETGTVGVNYLAEEVTLSDGTVLPINGRTRPTFDVRAGVERDAIGIPGLTGYNPPTFSFFPPYINYNPNTNDLFFTQIGNFLGIPFPIPTNPTRSNNATSADISIGGIAMLGQNAANGQVFLTNQYRPNRLLPGGNIEVGAIVTTDNIAQFANQLPANLRTVLNSVGLLNGFSGNGGSVILDSRSQITMNGTSLTNFGLNFGLINTSSGTGKAGDITLLASDKISLANTFILSDTSGAGRGGDITIKAPSVSFTDRTVVSSSTFGTGQGGKLTVIAPNSVDVAKSNLFAATTGDGNAGDLNIVTGKLTVQDEAAVATVSLGDGDAGNLKIDTQQLLVKDALITTSTLSGLSFGTPLGQGDGGELIINASDSVELVSTSADSLIDITIPIPGFAFPAIQTPIGLFSSSQSSGNAGKLTITTGRLTIWGGAMASTTTSFGGQGGDLTVNASERVELIGTSNNTTVPSALISDTYRSGKGGDITIITPHLLIKEGGAVSAATGSVLGGNDPDDRGQGGNVTVFSSLVELNGASSNPLLRSGLLTSTVGFGNAGDMLINADRLIIGDGAVVLTAALRDGNSGNLTVNASESVEVLGTAPDKLPSGISTGTAGSGAARDLTINTRRLTVRDGGLISAGTVASGAGGNLTVNASEWVELVGTGSDGRPSALSAGSGITGVSSIPLLQRFGVDPSQATGDSGDLKLTTGRLMVRDKAEVSTATLGPGLGGNIQVQANSIDLRNGAQLSAATSGSGRAGTIRVQEADTIDLNNSSISTSVNAGAAGQGGKIDLQTRSLSLNNGAQVSAATSGTGTAGDISVHKADTIALNNSSISTSVNAGAVVNEATDNRSGNINLQTRQLSLTNGAEVAAATSGQGDAGSIVVQEAEAVSLSNSSISTAVNAGAMGQGGTVDIQARSLSLDNGAQISAATSGTGRAGDISVHKADTIALNNSSISTSVNAGAVGEGGKIDLQTRSLSLDNGAQVSAATSGEGQAGNISVREADAVSLRNSAISTAVNVGAVGQGGDIDIQTRSLSVRDQARISANTSGDGKAGSITVTANTLEATNGGQLLTSTASRQDAGNINLTIKEDVKLTGEGTGIFANTTPGSTGNGGSIFLDTTTLLLRDGAGIAVGSQGAGEGGSITAQSNSTTLDNRAFISAKTASNTGGNITLGVQDLLLLRRGSEISTTAGTAQAGGDGGNITIAAGFILGIPRENSDITANAFTGRGGNINITTQGIFGLQFRPRLTPLSDITASSEFGLNGSVQIITPGVDPNRGLAELPTDLVDATELIDRRCVPGEGTEQSSSFTITGRGGLPPNPHETLGEEGLLEDLGTPVALTTGNRTGQQRRASASPSSSPQPLVEAQGWVIAPDGTVILTAQAASATPQHPWQTPASCQTLSRSSDAPIASPR